MNRILATLTLIPQRDCHSDPFRGDVESWAEIKARTVEGVRSMKESPFLRRASTPSGSILPRCSFAANLYASKAPGRGSSSTTSIDQ
jgi:hypothetical protein